MSCLCNIRIPCMHMARRFSTSQYIRTVRLRHRNVFCQDGNDLHRSKQHLPHVFPLRVWRRGLRENSDVCGCGTVDCTESTGLFCNAESNMCRSYTIPTCNDTSAQVANVFEVAGSKCACGLDTVCSLAAGSFCYAARSECSSDGNFDFFTKQMSASCGSNGLITDHDICDKARTALGLAATSVTSTSAWYKPYGCIFSNHGSYMYLNAYRYGRRTCGYNGMSCICHTRIPVCAQQDGSAPHITSEQCACGTATCSAETGMTCIAANSTCRTSSPCEFAEGIEGKL